MRLLEPLAEPMAALELPIGAQASSAPVVLDADTGRYAVSSQLEYVEDASGKLTFEEIRAAAGTRAL